jgi:glucokinase
MTALIGDIGGTNVRFELVTFLAQGKKHVLKELQVFNPQKEPSCEACIKKYLSEGVDKENYPSVCVIGIAGAVVNNSVNPVNIPGWETDQVGDTIKENCNF